LQEFRTLRSYERSPKTGYDYKAFKVEGADFVGYVIALVVVCHEDHAEYFEPSFFSVSRAPGTL
jgi:hypothetical protein